MVIHFDVSETLNIDDAVIICPNCQANYNIAASMLGDKGRQVKCAKCDHGWKAVAESKVAATEGDVEIPQSAQDINAENEAAMDAGFEQVSKDAEPTQALAEEPENCSEEDQLPDVEEKPLSSKARAQQEKDMARRKNLIAKAMPRARLTKVIRIMGAVLLAMVFFSGLFLRENIVRTFPDLAGLYGSVGLGVNVVGLEFAEVKTLRILREGDEVMEISAGIESVSSHQVPVPRIIVTLLDENDASVFEWSVTSRAAIMLPGEWIDFETQLISPPKEAMSVRLTFENLN